MDTEMMIKYLERAIARAEATGFVEYIPPLQQALEGLKRVRELDERFLKNPRDPMRYFM